MVTKLSSIRWFDTLSIRDVPLVGGKNASLGEMLRTLKGKGIKVPEGFATTSDAYWEFLEYNRLDEKIAELVGDLKKKGLKEVGKGIRKLILAGRFPEKMEEEIVGAYRELSRMSREKNVDVAVRSSATAEDLPSASFAGQQETYLNIRGSRELMEACKACFASLFTDRAIVYREAKKFDHLKIALSIGIQKMVRSDRGSSGVMFTLDTETGFRDVVVINGAWGLGENIVQGIVNPDEYVVFKPLLGKKGIVPVLEKKMGRKEVKMVYGNGGKRTVRNVETSDAERAQFVLSDQEILKLARWGAGIEAHYGKPMDIEWAKDGASKELYIVQARPETVQSQRKADAFKTYTLNKRGKVACEGLAIGEAIVAGKAQVIKHLSDIDKFQTGNILITEMTSPDWVPIMQRAAAIVTDHGGRTSHAAIVSRELGVPAIVGTNEGTKAIKDGQMVTVSCAEGDEGYIYDGIVAFKEQNIKLGKLPKIKTKIMMNIASPQAAFRWWRLPCEGIGLARMEFIINDIIKIHPMALVHFDQVKDVKERKKILELTKGYRDKKEYFIDHLARGIGKIAASRYPYPAIVRMSDFKTNEYANLIGGKAFEPKEENPMLGFRGASRYYNPRYEKGFALECAAIKRVREQMGLSNVVVMIPFCRTLEEADRVLKVMAHYGLKRGQKGLQVYVMAEIPSNVILAEGFADRFDGFSIGSNDLTQLVLGIDRDSEELSSLFDERNPAVKNMIVQLIKIAHRKKRKVGICGQAPSDYPEFADFLVKEGIDSISLNPDSIPGAIRRLGKRN
ncbi:MAG: phosphoenolpyruvate synthase [Verrucomicrobia bacterium]|nr:phosphoenolpyruvate synthase [Verrucomicrobiota bacterium]